VTRSSARPQLAALALSDPPEHWEALGFAVSANSTWLGDVEIRFGCPGRGIVGWSLRGAQSAVDGLPVADAPAGQAPGLQHPNGATGLDHVVILAPDFDRTASALESAGLALRRVAQRPDGARMGFRRLGSAILELVEAGEADAGPARFWGLVVIVGDLDALAARLGERLGKIRPAVQPGRRIATLHASAGLQQAVAFMDPEPA